MLLAWAFAKPQDARADQLGKWRYLLGAICGLYPHADEVLSLYSFGLYHQFAYGFTWSLLLAPFASFALAFSFSKLVGRPLEAIWPVTLITMVAISLMAVLTESGVALFAPFWDMKFRLSLINSFDVNFVFGALIVLVLGLMIPQFRVHIARLGLLSAIIYVVVLGTYHLRAYSFAKDYAQTMQLDVVKYHVLPQPVSTFNWRIMIETADDKIHDTRVNIFRKKEVRVRADFNRSKRLDALYKPMHKAVWRVYRRFGRHLSEQAKEAWRSGVHDKYRALTRYSVYLRLKQLDGNNCFVFQDLRYSGAKEKARGRFMFCRHAPEKYTLYRAVDEGRYVVLAKMY